MRALTLIVMIALGMTLWCAAPATAGPMVPRHGVKAPASIVQADAVCGPGFHIAYWGGCVPYGGYYYRPSWRYRHYGYYRPYWRHHHWHHRRW
jgi:hypothetical protein